MNLVYQSDLKTFFEASVYLEHRENIVVLPSKSEK